MRNTRPVTLLFVLLFIFGLKLTAQTGSPDPKKIEGAVFESKDFRRNHVVGYDNDGAFCYQQIKDLPQLVHISHQLATIKTYDIPLKLTNAGKEFEFVDWINPVLLGDKICFFYKTVLNEKQTSFRLIHTISVSDFTPLNKDIEISIENPLFFPLIMGSMQIQNIESSPDHSQLVQFFELTEGKPEETKISIFRHNNQIDKYTKTIISLPFEPDLNRIEQAAIDNSGNVYFLVYENFDKARTKYSQKNKLPAYQYYIYILPKGSDVPVKKEVTIAGKFISAAHLSFASNNDLICTGFYASKSSAGSFIGADGSFFIRYDAEKYEIAAQSATPFGDEFITNNIKYTSPGNEVGFSELAIRLVINQPDGSSILFTENDNERLIIIAFSPKGEVLWKNCIHTRHCWHFFGKCVFLVNENTIHIMSTDLIGKHQQSWTSDEVEFNYYTIDIKNGTTQHKTLTTSSSGQLSISGGQSGLMSSTALLVFTKHRSPNIDTKQFLLFDFSKK